MNRVGKAKAEEIHLVMKSSIGKAVGTDADAVVRCRNAGIPLIVVDILPQELKPNGRLRPGRGKKLYSLIPICLSNESDLV